MQMQTSAVERLNVDPRTLLVDTNIRLNANLNKEFVGSIKDLGVLQPIIAVRTPDGDIRVRYGHRRTLGAIQAGLDVVPVEVVGDESGTDSTQVDRIIRQHAENAHRSALTSTEEVHVVEQLTAFGLSAGQIQKRTRMKRDAVSQALVVSRSELAKASASRYDFLSLEQAATVADFENDGEAVKELVSAAKAGGFDHVAQRLRDERAEQQAIAKLRSELEASGIAVIDRPQWTEPAKRLAHLRDVDATTHGECPGHAAFIEEQWAPGNGERTELVAVFVCTDPETFGHVGNDGKATPATERTDQGAEAAREERRKVLGNNKAWRSAETVRREWLRSFLKRKTPPKGAQAFLMGELVRCPAELSKALDHQNPYARDLLGLNANLNRWSSGGDDFVSELETSSDARAVVLGLAVVLGAFEKETGVHSWRNATPTTGRYLRALQGWGYELSDVERLACGEVAA
jgi:ParB family chromosome partitioning protein